MASMKEPMSSAITTLGVVLGKLEVLIGNSEPRIASSGGPVLFGVVSSQPGVVPSQPKKCRLRIGGCFRGGGN